MLVSALVYIVNDLIIDSNNVNRPTILRTKRSAKNQAFFETNRFSVHNTVLNGVEMLKNFSQKSKVIINIILLYGIISLINNIIRNDILNFYVFGIVCIIYLFEDFSKNNKLILIIRMGLILTVIFDVIWVISNLNNYWYNKTLENYDSSLKKVIYILSWINIVVKGVLIYSIYISS